jgi:hypothetical protein
MVKTLIVLLAALAFAGMSLDTFAQQACPQGQVWHPDKGKCVTPRGSH